MQRRTILALLAPCALLAAPALADPGQPSSIPEVWPADTPPAPTETPAPTDAPAAPEAPVAPPGTPGWSQPSTAPGTATAPPTLPAPDAASPIALFAMRPPVASALYLQGFDVSWETRPHRLQSLVIVADAGAPAAATAPTGALLARVQGGSWADGEVAQDAAMVNLAYGGISSANAPIYRGAVRAALHGEASPTHAPEPALVTIPVEVPLTPAAAPAAGTPGAATSTPAPAPTDAPAPLASAYDGGAVFLQGLAIETDAGHPEGFTPHVLSVQLGPVTVADGVAHFDLTLEVQAAAVPDRDQHLASYGAEVEVGWVLVPASAARVHRLETSGGAAHGIEIDALQSRAEAVPLPLGVALTPGTTEVAVGLSGFRVAIDQTGLVAGRYLRSLGVTLADTGVDPWRSRWDGVVEARFSNAGDVTRAESVALQANVTVLELGAGDRAWAGRWSTSVTGEAQQTPYPGAVEAGTR
ncbi:MAG: hypothetical protein Q8P18_20160 [Pseudomonadota bacterium]|nr:hypothetical protein [Pseudomonadota bacterium]